MPFRNCVFAVIILALCALAARAGELALDTGRALIDPATLQVIFRAKDESDLVAATARAPAKVAELVEKGGVIAWKLPDVGLSVEFRADGRALVATFTSDRPGTLDWPAHSAGPGGEYLLPLGEGACVPADGDGVWAAYLAGRGPLATASDFSFPAWGVRFKAQPRTLTYVLDTPFGNTMTLAAAPDTTTSRAAAPAPSTAPATAPAALSAALVHTFSPLEKDRRYIVRIELSERDAGPLEPAHVYRTLLERRGQLVKFKDKIALVPDAAKLPGAAHVYLWGDGWTVAMMQSLADSGLDRLWLGAANWDLLRQNAPAVAAATARGYLVAPYDSYHSMHAPDQADTWETAQLGAELFESGAILDENLRPRKGFKGKGRLLSPIAAQRAVEARVGELMGVMHANSWFIDCDATGEVFDDYSPARCTTQQQDAEARCGRLAWIAGKYKAVVGSEGGSWYAAASLHFAHGMTTPAMGWESPELRDRSSSYFLGTWWPESAPAIFFKTVPMMPHLWHVHVNPRFRLPLYQAVFHDSVITTHHWESGSLKYADPSHDRELTELLYALPPLYHLDLRTWAKQQKQIIAHYKVFSPLARDTMNLPLSGFEYLTADRTVQRTSFGADGAVRVTANFTDAPFGASGTPIPPHAVLIERGAEHTIYQP